MALEHDFSVIDLNNLRAREFRAEEAAIQAVAEASFTDCLRLAGIAPERTIGEQIVKGTKQPLRLRGQDIYKAFTTFQAAHASDLARCRLVGIADRLAGTFVDWLVGTRSATLPPAPPRYRHVRPEDRDWLAQVAMLAVQRRIMEIKYHNQQKGTFMSQHARCVMEYMMRLRQAQSLMARAAHHVVGERAALVTALKDDIHALFRGLLATARADVSETAPPLLGPVTLDIPAMDEEDDNDR